MRALVLVAFILTATPALAEMDELVITSGGSLVLPGYRGARTTAFTTAGWDGSVGIEYGLLHDVLVGARFTFGQLVGVAQDYEGDDPKVDQFGDLAFDSTCFHPQLTARFKLFGGYNLAPYVYAAGGLVWAEFSNAEVLDSNNRHVSDASDFSRRNWTLEAGLIVDYRILNFLTVGVGATYVMVGDNLFEGMVRFPVRLGVYWF